MDDTKYMSAGVNLGAAADAVGRYRGLQVSTQTPGVLNSGDGYGGLFSLRDAGIDLKDPVFVTGADGVGTKLKLAFELNQHDTIGIDCVAMCANDVAARGARPLFFLDYLATQKLDPIQAETIVGGMASGCQSIGCALLGGETAEMPGFFGKGEYDVAGFCVGVVDRAQLLSAENVRPGDIALGLHSSGFHSNGYSLIRQIIAQAGLGLNEQYGLGRTLGAALLEPTRLYSMATWDLPGLRAAAHISGGAFYKNLPRILPHGAGIRLDSAAWEVPAVIEFILRAGNMSHEEGFRVFNMGIGMVLIVAPELAQAVLHTLTARGFTACQIGEVQDVPGVTIV